MYIYIYIYTYTLTCRPSHYIPMLNFDTNCFDCNVFGIGLIGKERILQMELNKALTRSSTRSLTRALTRAFTRAYHPGNCKLTIFSLTYNEP